LSAFVMVERTMTLQREWKKRGKRWGGPMGVIVLKKQKMIQIRGGNQLTMVFQVGKGGGGVWHGHWDTKDTKKGKKATGRP